MTDPKSTLNCFAQRHCKKVISKQDIVYTTQKFGSQYQATVTLNCLEGVQFAGEVAANPKQAEQNAASIALEQYKDQVEVVMAQPKSKGNNNSGTKRKAEGAVSEVDPAVVALTGMNPQDTSSKVTLNNMLMRILKRPLTKEDITFATVQTASGFQCTVTMPCLTGEWAGLGWAGEVSPKKKQAEENAAKQAVSAFATDPTMAVALNSNSVAGGPAAKMQKKAAGEGCGKGCGKGGFKGGFKGCGYWNDFSGMFPPEWMGMLGAMGLFKGKGKGKGGKGNWTGGPKPRTPVLEDPISGTVSEWKGKFGWIEATEPVSHEAAGKNKGRIFLHRKDWKSDIIEPADGTMVQFKVYVDPSGLGAEECVPL